MQNAGAAYAKRRRTGAQTLCSFAGKMPTAIQVKGLTWTTQNADDFDGVYPINEDRLCHCWSVFARLGERKHALPLCAQKLCRSARKRARRRKTKKEGSGGRKSAPRRERTRSPG